MRQVGHSLGMLATPRTAYSSCSPAEYTNRSPQQVPIGCFDADGHELTPNDYVIGFTRTYVYSAATFVDPAIVNHNPDIIGIVLRRVIHSVL